MPKHEKIIGILLLMLMILGGGYSLVVQYRDDQVAAATRAARPPTPFTLSRNEVCQIPEDGGCEQCPIYDPNGQTLHPIAYCTDMMPNEEGGLSYPDLPEREFPGNLRGPYDEGYEKAELVLKGRRIAKDFSHICSYGEVWDPISVNYYDADYELRLYIVHTGELLDVASIHVPAHKCEGQISWSESGSPPTQHVAPPSIYEIENFVHDYVYPQKN
jgi:hypothetical protein